MFISYGKSNTHGFCVWDWDGSIAYDVCSALGLPVPEHLESMEEAKRIANIISETIYGASIEY